MVYVKSFLVLQPGKAQEFLSLFSIAFKINAGK